MAKTFPKKYGLMFHHFHSSKYKKSEGSISKNDFEKILNKTKLKNIVSADQFLSKEKGICITFDDSLKCQYDIAYPILKKLKIKAFWFIYSSSLKPKYNNIEIFRIFRNTKFRNFNLFYNTFKKYIKNETIYKKFLFKEKNNIKNIKKNYSFYSINEIKFRIIRDKFLSKKQFNQIIKQMYNDFKFNYKKEIKKTFLNKTDLKNLSKNGQIIGLHSHNHPTKISKLNYNYQLQEYLINKKILEKIIKKKIYSSSHPSGDYNKVTLHILKKIGIKLSFRSNLKHDKKFNKTIFKNLVIPREDHTNLL